MAEEINVLFEEANDLVDSFEGVFETEEIDEQKKENFFSVLLIEASNLQHRINHQLSLNEAQDSLTLRALAQKIAEIVESLDPYLYRKSTDEPYQYNKDDESLSLFEREEASRFGLHEEPSLSADVDLIPIEQTGSDGDYAFEAEYDEESLNNASSVDTGFEYEDVENQFMHWRGSKNTMPI